MVSFPARLDTADKHKGGYRLNGYIVNISHAQSTKFQDKIIRIRGRVCVVRGLKHTPGEKIRQGREEDTNYIASPKIKIIN